MSHLQGSNYRHNYRHSYYLRQEGFFQQLPGSWITLVLETQQQDRERPFSLQGFIRLAPLQPSVYLPMFGIHPHSLA